MSLYEGIDFELTNKHESKKESWSSQIKLLQSQLQLKKSQSNQKSKLSKGYGLPITKDPEGNISQIQSNDKSETNITNNEIDNTSEEILPIVANEYDPKYPNDYDKIMMLREEAKERERADDWKKELEERDRRRREKLERNLPRPENSLLNLAGKLYDDEYPSENIYNIGGKVGGGIAIAPPQCILNDAETIVEGGDAEFGEGVQDQRKDGKKKAGFAPTLKNSVAAKIMAKYGFKQGQGLGKSEQGMSQALQVEKTSKRGGKILHEKDLPFFNKSSNLENLSQLYSEDDPSLSPSLTFDDHMITNESGSESFQNTLNGEETNTQTSQDLLIPSYSILAGALPPIDPTPTPSSVHTNAQALPYSLETTATIQAFKVPSKVVLLRNMVGSGEIDPDLENETREECSKYGEVKSCTVFEIPANFFRASSKSSNDTVSELDRVRIFVEFARVESAVKAVVDLNGRFFGGRIVRADFYNLDRYRTYDLGEGI
ncbi:unnamed protein product [Gordionus sp. m RMFG-2023]|uniref:splicing factor 45-like n=1 Tax=Gordionus sp. m RMFG-2023 TaxID=3053472 RepID=UPI0030E54B7F